MELEEALFGLGLGLLLILAFPKEGRRVAQNLVALPDELLDDQEVLWSLRIGVKQLLAVFFVE